MRGGSPPEPGAFSCGTQNYLDAERAVTKALDELEHKTVLAFFPVGVDYLKDQSGKMPWEFVTAESAGIPGSSAEVVDGVSAERRASFGQTSSSQEGFFSSAKISTNPAPSFPQALQYLRNAVGLQTRSVFGLVQTSGLTLDAVAEVMLLAVVFPLFVAREIRTWSLSELARNLLGRRHLWGLDPESCGNKLWSRLKRCSSGLCAKASGGGKRQKDYLPIDPVDVDSGLPVDPVDLERGEGATLRRRTPFLAGADSSCTAEGSPLTQEDLRVGSSREGTTTAGNPTTPAQGGVVSESVETARAVFSKLFLVLLFLRNTMPISDAKLWANTAGELISENNPDELPVEVRLPPEFEFFPPSGSSFPGNQDQVVETVGLSSLLESLARCAEAAKEFSSELHEATTPSARGSAASVSDLEEEVAQDRIIPPREEFSVDLVRRALELQNNEAGGLDTTTQQPVVKKGWSLVRKSVAKILPARLPDEHAVLTVFVLTYGQTVWVWDQTHYSMEEIKAGGASEEGAGSAVGSAVGSTRFGKNAAVCVLARSPRSDGEDGSSGGTARTARGASGSSGGWRNLSFVRNQAESNATTMRAATLRAEALAEQLVEDDVSSLHEDSATAPTATLAQENEDPRQNTGDDPQPPWRNVVPSILRQMPTPSFDDFSQGLGTFWAGGEMTTTDFDRQRPRLRLVPGNPADQTTILDSIYERERRHRLLTYADLSMYSDHPPWIENDVHFSTSREEYHEEASITAAAQTEAGVVRRVRVKLTNSPRVRATPPGTGDRGRRALLRYPIGAMQPARNRAEFEESVLEFAGVNLGFSAEMVREIRRWRASG